MNKTNTTQSTLNMIKSVCAERDRKERDRLEANRLNQLKREEAERERIQHSNNLLNSYIEKAIAREEQQKEKHNQTLQNIHDESVKRKSEDAYRTKEMTSAINRGIRNAEKKEEDSNHGMLSWNGIRECLIKGEKGLRDNRIRHILVDWVRWVGYYRAYRM